MSLQVWLPLTKDLRNQGLSNIAVTNNGATFNSAGKLGGCYKTSSSGLVELGYDGNKINTGSISLGGWFKFNKAEISSVVTGYSYTSTYPYPTGNIIGNDNYAGIGLIWTGNTMADGTAFNTLSVKACLRTATNGARETASYSIPFDTWTHIFMTFDKSTSVVKLYINGELHSSFTGVNFTDAPSRNLYINYKAIYGGNGPSYYIPFYCNDIRIYDHCLSEKEVKEISKGLVLHYPLNNNGYGNENLLKGTKFLDGDATVASGVTKTDNAYLGFTSATYNNSSGTSYYELIQWLSKVTVNANEVYTVSFYAKSPSSTTLTCYFYNNTSGIVQVASSVASTGAHNTGSDGNITLQLTPEWTRYWITWTFNDTATSATKTLLFRCLAGKTELSVCGVKLEKGNKATKWTPNSSEVSDNSIEYDISGFENNGTKSGSITCVNDSPKYGGSSYFLAGAGIFAHPNITLSQFTFSFWGKHTVLDKMLMGSNASTSSLNNNWYWYGDNSFKYPSGEFYYSHNAGTASDLLNKWTHFVAVYDGTNITIYRNGINEGSKALTGDLLLEYLSVGNGIGNSSYWENGYVSDFRIYATALSAEDILELYQQKGYANPFEGNNLIYYEYIQNNDLTQYIDLHTSLVNKMVEVKFQQTPLANSLNTIYGGEDDGDPWYAYGFRFNNGTVYMYLNGNLDTTGVNNSITTPAPDENIHIFKGIHKINQKSSATLDGEALPVVETIPNKFSARTAFLFATKGFGNPGGIKNSNLNLRIYYFKIWDENDNLTHYLRPCSYNGHTGMWNEIDNTFYPNCGKGEFTCGNIIE